tara:strand:+ start:434 stop:967 length:534 start_codon:yes stop_codon:yes gene_type:complete
MNKLEQAIKLLKEYSKDSKPSGSFSKYFTLEELVRSETATRQGITNKPSKAQEVQLRELCKYVLDPIREHFGEPIKVTSGYRCAKLNEVIGGSSKSQHMAKNGDCAVDFKFLGNKVDLPEVFKWITEKSNLNFDQCISEFLPEGWIHISYVSAGKPNRKKITVATKVKGKTIYKHKE